MPVISVTQTPDLAVAVIGRRPRRGGDLDAGALDFRVRRSVPVALSHAGLRSRNGVQMAVSIAAMVVGSIISATAVGA